MEGLDGVLEDWLDGLHDTESSLHIVDLWLHALDGLHLSGDLNEWLSVIESLEDSSGKSLLDVLDGSSLGNSGGLVISGLGSESGVEGGLEVGDELGVRHGFELSLFVDKLNIVVMVVVVSGSGGSDESEGELHCCENNLRKNTFEEEKLKIQNQLKLFQDCKAPCMVFAEVYGSIQGDPNINLSKRPRMDLDESKKYYKKISEMGKYLEDQDMPLAYHHHMGTCIESEEDTRRLLENTDGSVKLTLDTGHMLFAKGDSLKIYKEFKERIIHIHCKDMRKNVLDNSLNHDYSFRQAFLEGVFTVPGDGCIDYKPFFELLKKQNYSGWLVVEAEQDPAKANPFEYAKIGYKYLIETLKSANLEIENN